MNFTCVDMKMERRKLEYSNLYSEQATGWATNES